MHKNVKKCRMQKKRSFQLIHTESIKKRGKLKISKKLSTLSTLKNPFYVNYSVVKKNECFGEIWWNSEFVEKKRKKCWLLSSQKSDFKGCTILKIYCYCSHPLGASVTVSSPFLVAFGEGLDIMANVTLLTGRRAAECTTPCEL